MPTTARECSERFALPGLSFDQSHNGLVRAVVETSVARGELSLQGAHCTAWQPAGHEPVLWMSRFSHFDHGKPIRGGVPICFPWFGPHPSDATLPAHGVARLSEWKLFAVEPMTGGGIRLRLAITIAPFQLEYSVDFGSVLKLALTTQLPKEHAQVERFEDALHSYFCVGDVRSIAINGLETVDYIDKLQAGALQPASQSPIRFSAETDRVYQNTRHSCTLHDTQLARTITIDKTGSSSTVVWNPWIEKSARMPDFGDNEWPGMVCIETANVGTDAIHLQPGEAHTTVAVISLS